MRNVRSTCESMAQHTSPNSSRAPRDADEYPAITVVLSESANRKLTRNQLRGLLALRAGPAYDSKLLFSADSHQWFSSQAVTEREGCGPDRPVRSPDERGV